jgi:hypothetical protein
MRHCHSLCPAALGAVMIGLTQNEDAPCSVLLSRSLICRVSVALSTEEFQRCQMQLVAAQVISARQRQHCAWHRSRGFSDESS